jgi:signal transduction histidine kinase/ActR/RegA family two-component response regulator
MKVLIVDKTDAGLNYISAFVNRSRFALCHAIGIDDAFLMLQGNAEPLSVIINLDELAEDAVTFCELVRNTSISITPYIIGYSKNADALMGTVVSEAIDDYIFDSITYEQLNYRLKVAERIVNVQKHLLQSLDERDNAIQQLNLANQKRYQLYSMIAHELRTPVAVIDMMNQIDDPERWQQHRGEVKDATNTLLYTIDDMRMLVNPKLKRPIRNEHVRIKDLISSIRKKSLSVIEKYNLAFREYHFVREFTPEQMINIDVYRVHVALNNLVKNACAHSNGSQIEIMSRIRVLENKVHICWSVSDNGVGIPESFQKDMFEPRVSQDTDGPNMGMGLFIVKELVQEINGQLCYRRLPKGSLFEIAIPLELVDLEGKSEADLETKAEFRFSQKRILIVEDDDLLRQFSQTMLTKHAKFVDVSASAKEALERNIHNYEILLVDNFMAELSGTDFIKIAREQEFSGIIVAITAESIGVHHQALLKNGADAIMFKPLSLESLDAALAIETDLIDA